jgi:hypothetical protein
VTAKSEGPGKAHRQCLVEAPLIMLAGGALPSCGLDDREGGFLAPVLEPTAPPLKPVCDRRSNEQTAGCEASGQTGPRSSL